MKQKDKGTVLKKSWIRILNKNRFILHPAVDRAHPEKTRLDI